MNQISPKAVQQILDSQPFSKEMGTRAALSKDGQIAFELEISEKINQQHGFVHGGVVSYLGDTALAFTGAIALGSDVLTSEYKINFTRPAMGKKLVARGEALSTGKSQAVCLAKIYSVDEAGQEKLCAVAQGTIIALRRDQEVATK